MSLRLTSFLLLAAITLQGVFGGLHESVVLCLGGGHEHGPTEVVEHCELECSHHGEWPAPENTDDHRDDCGCTDIELALLVLLTIPRDADQDLTLLPPVSTAITYFQYELEQPSLYDYQPILKEDPGGIHRLALIRSTRLIV